MKKHLSFLFVAVAVAIACTRNASAATTAGLGAAGLGADVLSLPGIHATVTTGTVAMAVRRGNAVGVLKEVMGSGDGAKLNSGEATLGYMAGLVEPEIRVGALSATGADFTGASVGYVMGGLVLTENAVPGLVYTCEILDGNTFAASSNAGSGSGRAYKVGVGVSESLTQRVTLIERYSDERLAVGDGAIVDHSTTISIADRF